jgi:hypothetical protein
MSVGCAATRQVGPRCANSRARGSEVEALGALGNLPNLGVAFLAGTRTFGPTQPRGVAMSYHVECDWCGQWLAYADDQAQMCVTIYHRKGRSRLEGQWSEETKQTRHFCASPKEDTDHTGSNRMGLIPEDGFDSCYDRAIAAMTRVELTDPGMGLEWRLVQVGEKSKIDAPSTSCDDKPGKAADDDGEVQNRHVRERLERAKLWGGLDWDRRADLVVQALGDDQVTTRDLAVRINAHLGSTVVYDGDVSKVVKRLLGEGRLERTPGPARRGSPYRYFRTSEPA